MAEYTSKFTGAEIDERLGKVPELAEHTENSLIHVTEEDKMNWGSKASQSAFSGHINNIGIHTCDSERSAWDSAVRQAALNKSSLGYQRKNLLKITAQTTTVNGVAFTVNSDGSITANGTASADAALDIGGGFALSRSEKYILTGCPSGGGDSAYRLYGLETVGWTGVGSDVGEGAEFTPYTDNQCVYRIVIRSGVTADDLTFYPMLRYADISDDTFEPYKPSIEERLAALEEKL